jgi:polyisoprenyl-phosphate glycosyltransferase
MALISIIVPVYYNESSLIELSDRLDQLASRNSQHEFEFIYVDDGSGDQSYNTALKIASSDKRVKVVKLVRNFGSGPALLAGMTYARGDCMAFIAADLQDPPEALDEMIVKWQNGSPVVLAMRKDRQGDPLFTRIPAGIFNYLFKHLIYNNISPQGVGFTLIDRRVVDEVIKCNEKNAHLIGLILWTGFPYSQIEYDRAPRKYGKSRWTFQKKLKYFIDAFIAFTYLPLRVASVLGIIFAALGSIYAVLILIARLMNKIPVEGWATLTILVLCLSGIQLLMLGILGEYLWRNFDSTRKRPIFIVDKFAQNEPAKEDREIRKL